MTWTKEMIFAKKIVNSKISGKAVRLLCCILLNQKEYVTFKELKKITGLGTYALRKAETELEQHGIIIRNKVRINGRIRGVSFLYLDD